MRNGDLDVTSPGGGAPAAAGRGCLLAALVLLVLACAPASAPLHEAPVAPTATTVIYLVRHAETVPPPYESDPPNPRLSEYGHERATALARVLEVEDLETVWSTDYRRTQETAAPTAALHGLEVVGYDPRDLAGFASRLRSASGRVLVVGHSNTTPALVEALGGNPGTPIDERTEYDRLYVVTVHGGAVTTSLLRYGPARDVD